MSATGTEILKLDLGSRSYDIVVGENLLDQAGDYLAPLMTGKRAIIVSDDTVAPLYLGQVIAALENSAIGVTSVVVPSGEASKDFDHLRDLTDHLFEASVDRSTLLVALGGGGDRRFGRVRRGDHHAGTGIHPDSDHIAGPGR